MTEENGIYFIKSESSSEDWLKKKMSWKKFQRKLRKILRKYNISNKVRDKKINDLMKNYYGYGLKND